MTSLPVYLLLDHTGLLPDDMRWAIWLLSLTTLVPAALLLVYLVGRTAESIAPGWGRFTAVAFGAGTLILPFGSLWFAQVPAAARIRGVRRRATPAKLERSSVRGWPARGSTVLFEYPLALVAVALLVYVAICHGLRGGLRFVAGSALPAACLLLYNRWAFGSISHFLPVRAAVADHLRQGGRRERRGVLRVTWPSGDALAEIFFSPRGS